jgi:maleate isomerase
MAGPDARTRPRGIEQTISPIEWRASFGTLVFIGNMATEADVNRIAPPGITVHASRIVVDAASQTFRSEEEFLRSMAASEANEPLERATKAFLVIKPRRIMYAVTSTTMWNGAAGAAGLRARMEEWSGGIPVTLAGDAIVAALRALGVHRIAMTTPYPDSVAARMVDFLAEADVEVVRRANFKTRNIRDILQSVTPKDLMRTFIDLDGDDVDAVVQTGGNMSILGVSQMAERILGKPVLPINEVVLWACLRAEGFEDRIPGFSVLFRDH